MLNKLDEREKLFVIGGVILVIVVLFFSVIRKLAEFRSDLSEKIVESRGSSVQLDKLIKDYHFYKSLKSGPEEDVSQIYSKLDQILIRYSLKDKVSTMRDSNTVILKQYNKITIDISLRSVPLNDVIKLIYDIEVNKQINSKVDYINFRKPFAGKEIYDVNLKLSSYSKLGKKNA
ncbi:MAG: hypothetical protein L6Q54_01140 [Leptospiraceae bacterium]|nr:hypothetical protein [Leptospiraceae bacterium]MCK6379844.1 hypothetical protein [Leptospiraceae bacterium]NUM41658.1 hypothetical protein [Leptospiraceae bacterium]